MEYNKAVVHGTLLYRILSIVVVYKLGGYTSCCWNSHDFFCVTTIDFFSFVGILLFIFFFLFIIIKN